jgi:hypothetical protein
MRKKEKKRKEKQKNKEKNIREDLSVSRGHSNMFLRKISPVPHFFILSFAYPMLLLLVYYSKQYTRHTVFIAYIWASFDRKRDLVLKLIYHRVEESENTHIKSQQSISEKM